MALFKYFCVIVYTGVQEFCYWISFLRESQTLIAKNRIRIILQEIRFSSSSGLPWCPVCILSLVDTLYYRISNVREINDHQLYIFHISNISLSTPIIFPFFLFSMESDVLPLRWSPTIMSGDQKTLLYHWRDFSKFFCLCYVLNCYYVLFVTQ